MLSGFVVTIGHFIASSMDPGVPLRPRATALDLAIEERRWDTPGVRTHLDNLPITDLVDLLGDPRRVTYFAETYGRHWKQGDGRPLLAVDNPSIDEPAVQQAIGMCASDRVRGRDKRLKDAVGGKFHPVSCTWCAWPLEQLLAVCEWAVFESRYIVHELLVWDGAEGSTYVRRGRAPGYTNPEHVRFWAQSERMRDYQVGLAAQRSEAVPA